MFSRELNIAIKAAKKAGSVILEYYNLPYNIQEKNDLMGSPVTEADLEANSIIARIIQDNFPEDGIISEEERSINIGASKVWVIDPLDGTKEFINKNGEFSIQIGLLLDKKPVLGVVLLPVKNELYYAVKGEGAFRLCSDNLRRMFCRTEMEAQNEIKMARSRSHVRKEEEEIFAKIPYSETISHGSVGGKASLLLQGKADFFLYCGGSTHEWDICAPEIIVAEAGGVVTSLKGNPVKYVKEKTNNEDGLLIASEWAHKKILKTI